MVNCGMNIDMNMHGMNEYEYTWMNMNMHIEFENPRVRRIVQGSFVLQVLHLDPCNVSSSCSIANNNLLLITSPVMIP